MSKTFLSETKADNRNKLKDQTSWTIETQVRGEVFSTIINWKPEISRKKIKVPNRETVSLSSNPLDENEAMTLERSSWGLGSSYVAISG